MITTNIQILLLKSSSLRKREAPNEIENQDSDFEYSTDHKIVKRATAKDVKYVLELVKVYNDTMSEILVVSGRIEAGQ